MDFLDMLKPKAEGFLTAFYYAEKPKANNGSTKDTALFQYSYESAYSKRFSTVLESLRLDEGTCQIKTNDNLGFKNKGYVSTQDGIMWQIQSIQHDEQVRGSEEALYTVRANVQSVFHLLLSKVDNPWGIDT